jgi:phosphatidate cytidylyltransferase
MIPINAGRPRAFSIFVAVLLSTMPSCLPVLFPEVLLADPWHKLGWTALGWAAVVGWVFAIEMWGYRANDQALVRIEGTIFVAIYIGMLSFLAHLRFLIDNTWGVVALLSLVVTVKMSDSFAYLIGRAIGKRKLTPALSPGKTVEGGIAALVFGGLGALLVLLLIAYLLTGSVGRTTVLAAMGFGLVVTIAGVWGDLVESLIKRESAVKDSGSLIPGMGGVLDVMDSILGAAPFAFALWLAELVGK